MEKAQVGPASEPRREFDPVNDDIRDLVEVVPEPSEQQIAAGVRAIDEYYNGTKDATFEGSVAYVYRAMRALEPTAFVTVQDDVRWAVNVLLEKIAAKFEENPTWDLWRSDAAALVRSFKHAHEQSVNKEG